MGKHLVIVEVSQKQAYIFGSRKLRDNLRRSEEIRYVTSPEFFAECCPELYSNDNLVNAGGGHTVLEFDDETKAKSFAAAVSRRVLERYPQMELFIRCMEYDETGNPGENLNALTQALEEKKARRRASFYRRSFGIDTAKVNPEPAPERPEFFERWKLTDDGNVLGGEDNFLAVVHVDGNSMGKRVQKIYFPDEPVEWDECVRRLRLFSGEIQAHFDQAYQEMCMELSAFLTANEWKGDCFPVRKVIGAGDDVTFVCAGNLGIYCAVSFIRSLNKKINAADGRGYAACAGVCMVHTKYPFRAAYDMAEQLCSSAKRFGAGLDPECGISAIDWHIEFGQLKDSLAEIRTDYLTEDGGRLELRPYAVSWIGEEAATPPVIPNERRIEYFDDVVRKLNEQHERLPRSKIKSLRDAFKRGEPETLLELKKTGLGHILEIGVEQRIPDWRQRTQQEGKLEKPAFLVGKDGRRRCLYFDAVEMMDHITLWGGDAHE